MIPVQETRHRRRSQRSFEEFDWHLLGIALVLTLIGLTFVWSTTHTDSDAAGLVPRQILYVGAVLPLVALMLRFPYPLLARLAVPAYLSVILLLLFLLMASNDSIRSTKSWIRLPMGFSLQPSEFAKVAVVLIVAAYLRFRPKPKRLKDLVGPFALTLFPMLLVARQPDLGSAIIMLPVLLAMLFSWGMPIRLLSAILGGGLLICVALYFSPLMHDYQRLRIRSFFESIPEQTEIARELRADGRHLEAARAERRLRSMKQGGNFQVYHAMISIGSGGVFGKGIGRGPQNRLDYLPERHNDFIFAVVGEEWGFVGASIILGLYFLLVVIMLGVARRTRDAFGRLICVGIATLFGFQVFLNTGVATGLLPVTGVTLPFMSFGGSSMLCSYIALALVLNVGAHRITVLEGESFRGTTFGESDRPMGARRRS